MQVFVRPPSCPLNAAVGAGQHDVQEGAEGQEGERGSDAADGVGVARRFSQMPEGRRLE